jgi:peptide/nickel transport system substrate-binding protein
MPSLGYNRLRRAYQKLSPVEFALFVLLGLLLTASVIGLVGNLQSQLSTTEPARGGAYSEGIVGFPRYINPVLASSNADRDLSALIYAGLTKLDPAGGVKLDLASQMKISEDGETYTFTIRDDARFHDGHPVQAADVVYTINIIKDQQIDSPQAADWTGIMVTALDRQTVEFQLPDPFSNFPYNARIGILPKHQWQDETTQTFPFSPLNTDPVGSGPYEVADVERNADGIPTGYQLKSSPDYPREPFISKLSLRFFADEAARQAAFADGEIDAMYGLDPRQAARLEAEGAHVLTSPLNRIFAVFFNQSQNKALVELAVREALADVIPKQRIVADVLNGYGSVIDGPLPAEKITSESEAAKSSKAATLAAAGEKLSTTGWELTDDRRTKDGETLTITITTADLSSLQETADIIAVRWGELGVDTEVISLPASELTREIIRPREYEALLFGQSINPSRDLYPFWHSEAQDDPGLNLARYANANVDNALATLRTASSAAEADRLEQSIIDSITADQPTVFLYTPAFIYVLPKKVRNVDLPALTTPAERFAQVEKWYINTTNLWNIFSDPKSSTTSRPATTSEARNESSTTSPPNS